MSALPPTAAPSPEVQQAIEAAWATLDAEQGLGLPCDAFVAHVAHTVARRAGPEGPLACLAQLALGDVYLAQAGLHGSERAVRRFFEQHAEYIRSRCAKVADGSELAQEVADELLTSLFMPRRPEDPRSARLWSYGGLGSLRGWLKVTTRRLVLDRARQRRPAASEAAFDHLQDPRARADDRLAGLDGAARLRPLFVESVNALSADEVRLLRKSYRDQLVLREIADELGVQPSTIFRRLNRIREKIWAAFTRRAEAELGLSPRALRDQLSHLADHLDLDDLLQVALVLAGLRPWPWRPA